MRRENSFYSVIITAVMIFTFVIFDLGQYSNIHKKRWDLQMIQEAPIWKNLLVKYSLADQQRVWPERKEAMQTIIEKFPESRWADDAALVLACGKASFENNSNGAIEDLNRIIQQYPNSGTIVVQWSPDDGCIYDDTWLMWQGGLVFLNKDGSIRSAKPFDIDGELSQLEKESLAYFSHLKRCPRSTAVMAMLIKSQVQYFLGNQNRAIVTLETIVQEAKEYLAEVNRADKIAASKTDGYYIRRLANRPEYRAYLNLIGFYEKQSKMDKAMTKAEELSNNCSKDGWLWMVNRNIGNFYERHGLSEEAKKQFILALTGLSAFKTEIEARRKLVTGSDFPDDFWETNRINLEMKIKKISESKKK